MCLKKDFPFITSEKAFTYPVILLVVSLIFLLLFKNIYMYKQDIVMAENHLEHLIQETILQMSLKQLQEDLLKNKNTRNFFYTFPPGNSKITIHKLSEHEFLYEISIRTKNNSHFDHAGFLETKH